MPSPKKQQRGQARHRNHVGVFGHEEHGKLHGTVLGVVSRNQFGFGFRQVKRKAIGLRIRRHQINEEADNLPMKNIPPRNETPEMSSLCIDDSAQAEAAGLDQNSNQRKSKRNFVTDHLRAGPQSAQQGIFIVRRPARKRHAVYTHRSNAQNQQQPDVYIGNLQRDIQAANRDRVAKRDHRNRSQGKDQCHHRRRQKQRLVDVRRREVFLEQELQPVGRRLQQSKRPDPRGSPPILDMAHHFAFQPDRVRDRGEQHDQDDH